LLIQHSDIFAKSFVKQILEYKGNKILCEALEINTLNYLSCNLQ